MVEYLTLFAGENLPPEGWIQTCIMCNDICSSTEKVFSYNIYICGKCKKKYRAIEKLRRLHKLKNSGNIQSINY